MSVNLKKKKTHQFYYEIKWKSITFLESQINITIASCILKSFLTLLWHINLFD